ncbi:MAG: methyltransferase domain-containing protein [Gammaproteobacteria bacterium]|nr:methyltransferase domain-containing protein [Gammaproteobacteria bacterium]
MPLTQIAHARVAAHLRPGDLVVDATAGNGHDTLFLARQVAPGGRVFAFDVQSGALEHTAARLQTAGLRDHVELVHDGHQNLLQHLPREALGKIRAAMFNLGYLPGGDKQRTTQGAHTVEALRQGIQALDPSGVISILVYRGHAGGLAEAAAVEHWLGELPGTWRLETVPSPGPVLHLVTGSATDRDH